MAPSTLTAAEITAALVDDLLESHPDAVVLREFTCPAGRVDLLAITDALHGFEVKSDFDSLQRVDAQLAAYSRYCQTLTFVAGRTLAIQLLRSLPSWCGVRLAIRGEHGVSLLDLRESRRNPLADAQHAALLLHREELRSLTGHQEARASRAKLRKLFTSSADDEVEMFERIAASLRRRAPLRSVAQRESCDDSSLPEATFLGFQFASSPLR